MEAIVSCGILWLVASALGSIGRTYGICPHCGHYCTGKSAWCRKRDALGEEDRKQE